MAACQLFLLQRRKQCFGWVTMWGREGGGAGAGRIEEEEGVGKVGRVALNNVAIHSAFRVHELVWSG